MCACNLHAVASCQVTMQEVTTTEIFHTQCNVNHELQECLRGQELEKRHTGIHTFNYGCLKSEVLNKSCNLVAEISPLDSLPGVNAEGSYVDPHTS